MPSRMQSSESRHTSVEPDLSSVRSPTNGKGMARDTPRFNDSGTADLAALVDKMTLRCYELESRVRLLERANDERCDEISELHDGLIEVENKNDATTAEVARLRKESKSNGHSVPLDPTVNFATLYAAQLLERLAKREKVAAPFKDNLLLALDHSTEDLAMELLHRLDQGSMLNDRFETALLKRLQRTRSLSKGCSGEGCCFHEVETSTALGKRKRDTEVEEGASAEQTTSPTNELSAPSTAHEHESQAGTAGGAEDEEEQQRASPSARPRKRPRSTVTPGETPIARGAPGGSNGKAAQAAQSKANKTTPKQKSRTPCDGSEADELASEATPEPTQDTPRRSGRERRAKLPGEFLSWREVKELRKSRA